LSRQAMEHSTRAYQAAQEAHRKSENSVQKQP
jgi:hypothetical protein